MTNNKVDFPRKSLAQGGLCPAIEAIKLSSHFVFIAFLAACLALQSSTGLALSATQTSITSDTNPSTTFQAVTLTAFVRPTQVSADIRFPLSVGTTTGSSRIVRYEFSAIRFTSDVSGTQLSVPANPSRLGSAVVAQGGRRGDTYVVFQVSAAGAGLAIADILSFSAPNLELLPESPSGGRVVFSVHETLSSACCQVSPNSALLFKTDAALFDFVSNPLVTGSVAMTASGVSLPGCSAVALQATGNATCTTSFSTAGLQTVTAVYSGDSLYATSSATLPGGQLVNVGGSNTASLRANVNPAPLGQRMFLTMLIAGQNLAGKVTFTEPGEVAASQTVCANVPLSNNGESASALCEVPPQNRRIIGKHLYTANFVDDLGIKNTAASLEVVVKSATQPLQLRSSVGQSLGGSLIDGKLVFIGSPDPGRDFEVLGVATIDSNRQPDLVFRNAQQGDRGDVRIWKDGNNEDDRLLRTLRLAWKLEAAADLDGDGLGDLVWRFTGQSPNIDDTGVSYVWFTNGVDVAQVRKRGGAPLSWRLLGAVDVNQDRSADMVYLGPEGQIRLLMATKNRTCANISGGQIPAGFNVLKLGDFSGNSTGDLFLHNSATGETMIYSIDASGLALPEPVANPDDANASCTPTSLAARISIRSSIRADVAWRFYAAADLNSDGLQDLVWLKPDGSLIVWQMLAGAVGPVVFDNAGTAPVGFSVIGP